MSSLTSASYAYSPNVAHIQGQGQIPGSLDSQLLFHSPLPDVPPNLQLPCALALSSYKGAYLGSIHTVPQVSGACAECIRALVTKEGHGG